MTLADAQLRRAAAVGRQWIAVPVDDRITVRGRWPNLTRELDQLAALEATMPNPHPSVRGCVLRAMGAWTSLPSMRVWIYPRYPGLGAALDRLSTGT